MSETHRGMTLELCKFQVRGETGSNDSWRYLGTLRFSETYQSIPLQQAQAILLYHVEELRLSTLMF